MAVSPSSPVVRRRIWPAYVRAPGHRLKPTFRTGLLLVCSVSTLAVVLLVGGSVLLHPSAAAVGSNPASDFQIMTWSLGWWPWALLHGVNPLHTSLLWPPSGFSTLWITTIPVPALIASPLTLLAGPLVSYNVLMILAVPLAAGAAYLLCWELTRSASSPRSWADCSSGSRPTCWGTPSRSI